MPPSSRTPHRLRVSALAAMVNPSSQRLDVWHLLDDATQQLAAVHRAGLDTAVEEGRVRRQLDRLDAYERYWLYPGPTRLDRAAGALRRDGHRRAGRRRSTWRPGCWRSTATGPPCSTTPRAAGGAGAGGPCVAAAVLHGAAGRRLATHLTRRSGRALRRLRQATDEVQYEILRVTSVEDAITAVALNGEIQAAIVRHDLPLRSTDRLPIMTRLLGVETLAVATDRTYDWVECGQWIRELRPRIDLYLLTDESIVAGAEEAPGVYDRTFYRLNDVTDLHSTVLAGISDRFRTPFFDALRAYAASPVGQFHALPVARGASIFNSRSLRDMGEFYGRNIFMAETSSTSGGLDSLLDPHGALREAMDKAAAHAGTARPTYFVTNGTSTANKIVVQSLTRPGDIVLIDRNCHKSHHYGLVLAGAHPVYLDAYPLADYSIYGARAAGDDQADAAGPGGGRSAGPGAHGAADQLHLRRGRLQPRAGDGGAARDQAGHLLPVGRGLVRLRGGRARGSGSGRRWWPRERLGGTAGQSGVRRRVRSLARGGWPTCRGRSGPTTGCCRIRERPGSGSTRPTPPTSRCRRCGRRR